MKKITKICLTLSAAAGIIGIILCIAGCVIAGGIAGVKTFVLDNCNIDFSNNFITYTNDYDASSIENLTINTGYGDVEIYTDDSTDKITVTTKGISDNIVSEKGKDITIDNEDITIDNNVSKIDICIPSDKKFKNITFKVKAGEIDADYLNAENIKINAGAGDISCDNVTAAKELSISVGAGCIEINNGNTAKLDAECGMGELDYYGTISGDVFAKCGVGDINFELDNSENDFNYKIESAVGTVNIGDTQISGISSVKKIDNGADKTFTIDCGVGEIDVNN